MARKKPSKYQQELQRVRRRIKSLEKQGYIVNTQIPKKASIQKLKKEFSLEALYEKAFYVNPIGEIIPAIEERKARRSESARKGWQTRRSKSEAQPISEEAEYVPYEETIFRHLYDIIGLAEAWTPEPQWTPEVTDIKRTHKDAVLDLLQSFELNAEDKLQAATRIEKNAGEVAELAERMMYATYSPNLVYYPPKDEYNFTSDYMRLCNILGTSAINPFEDTGYDEDY